MLTREDVTYWFCRYRMLDIKHLEERRRLIDGFVNSVIMYDEYIVITFNYKEGTTTVPFSKLDSSDLSSVGGPIKPKELLLFRFYYFCRVRDSNHINATVRCTFAWQGESRQLLKKTSRWEAFCNESRHMDLGMPIPMSGKIRDNYQTRTDTVD